MTTERARKATESALSRPHGKVPLVSAVAPLRPQAGLSARDPRAIAGWLARAHSDPAQAAAKWRTDGLAVMPLGVRYSAVRVPDTAVATVSGLRERGQWDAYLCDVVGGPVICDPVGHRYYLLVARRAEEAWAHLAESWRTVGIGLLGDGVVLGMPSPYTGPDPLRRASYWASPAPRAGVLCPPLAVLQLIDAALTAQAVESSTEIRGQL